MPRLPGDALAARRSARALSPSGFRRVYLFHVRKTAGTSLAMSFLALGGEDPRAVFARMATRPHTTRSRGRVFVHHERALLQQGHYLFGWSHHPWWYLKLPPATFTVTVLREPLERLVSLYAYLADARSDEGLPFPAPAEDRKWAEGGFSAFLDRVPANAALNQLHTFSESRCPEEAAERIRGLDAYFFTANYRQGLSSLVRRLGLPLVERTERASVATVGLSGAELARARDVVADEYRLLDLLRRDPGPSLVGTLPPAQGTAPSAQI